jgi:hypothetical protein
VRSDQSIPIMLERRAASWIVLGALVGVVSGQRAQVDYTTPGLKVRHTPNRRQSLLVHRQRITHRLHSVESDVVRIERFEFRLPCLHVKQPARRAFRTAPTDTFSWRVCAGGSTPRSGWYCQRWKSHLWAVGSGVHRRSNHPTLRDGGTVRHARVLCTWRARHFDC